MNAESFRKQSWYKRAVCLTRERGGKTEYRIAPEETRVGQTPPGGYLSNWCSSEVRAWTAAFARLADRAADREHW